MKFECSRVDLARVLSVVHGAVPARTSVPVLANVRVSAENDKVTLRGTDLEMGAERAIDAKVSRAGVALLPADKLSDILKHARDEKITFDVTEKSCVVKIEGGQFKMATADPADYPQWPKFAPEKGVKLSRDAFVDMVQRTSFAVSTEASRYAITGVLFVLRAKEARMVGTDGKRLAYAKRKIEGGPAEEVRVIIPASGLGILADAAEDEGEISFEFEESQVKASSKDGAAFCRLVEGSYPNYEDVIPEDTTHTFEAKADDLAYGIKLISTLTDDRSPAMRMDFADDKLKLNARRVTGNSTGEAAHVVAGKFTGGGEVGVSFNPGFFLDFLRVVQSLAEKDDGHVKMSLKGDKYSAAVLRAGSDYLYLVMPLTIE